MPITGIFTACRHSCTMRTAIGRIAGPLEPPTPFEIFGRRVSTSIDHREERVDERHGVGAGLFRRARERGDVGDVRRQLRDDRQPRHLAHRADDVEACRRGCSRTECRLP